MLLGKSSRRRKLASARIFAPHFLLDPHRDPHGETSGWKQRGEQVSTSSFLEEKAPKSLARQGVEGFQALGKDEVGGSNPPSSSRKQLISSGIGCFSLRFATFRGD